MNTRFVTFEQNQEVSLNKMYEIQTELEQACCKNQSEIESVPITITKMIEEQRASLDIEIKSVKVASSCITCPSEEKVKALEVSVLPPTPSITTSPSTNTSLCIMETIHILTADDETAMLTRRLARLAYTAAKDAVPPKRQLEVQLSSKDWQKKIRALLTLNHETKQRALSVYKQELLRAFESEHWVWVGRTNI